MGIFSPPATTQTTSPYGGGGPLNDALSLYKKKQLNPYVAPGSVTRGAQTQLINNAQYGHASLNDAMATLRRMSQGGGDVSSAGQTDIATRAMGPSYAEQNLSGVARGDMLGANDPNFERMLSSALDTAGTQARMSAGAQGRYGGDFAQTEVARTTGDLEASQRYQKLNDERSRQVEANSLMDTMRQQGLGLGLNATNSASSINAANQDRRMSGANAIPGIIDAKRGLFNDVLGVGQMKDADTGNRLGAPGSNLSSLMQILQGYGTQTNKTGTNTAGMIGGAGLGLASLLSSLFGK